MSSTMCVRFNEIGDKRENQYTLSGNIGEKFVWQNVTVFFVALFLSSRGKSSVSGKKVNEPSLLP